MHAMGYMLRDKLICNKLHFQPNIKVNIRVDYVLLPWLGSLEW